MNRPQPKYDMQPVQSSNLAAVGYDAATRTLRIEFHASGKSPSRTYQYEAVAPEEYKALLEAPSKGRDWQQRKSAYVATRVG